MALDLITTDPVDNKPWDYNNKDKRDRTEKTVRSKQALLLIGSPMCIAFSRLQHFNFARLNPEQVHQIKESARVHLEFCMKLYISQKRQKILQNLPRTTQNSPQASKASSSDRKSPAEEFRPYLRPRWPELRRHRPQRGLVLNPRR